ncbi:MAG: IS982 family transposase, partial [bacterium]|nr:IS982 family transposase [bacterium]
LVDNFVNTLNIKDIPMLVEDSGKQKRNRKTKLSLSEMVTIIVLFHESGYRTFKWYYLDYVCVHMRGEFPHLISYSRFIAHMKKTTTVLMLLMQKIMGENTGISFVDSTSISVCHNKRITRNKTFFNLAAREKSSMGWFFGFKLHLIVNDKGEIQALNMTKGNVDDRVPVPKMVKNIRGKLFGDKGYLSSELFKELWEKGIHLVTTIRKNMKPKLMPLKDRILLRKRFIVETINDQLKNICQIEHSRHRSPINFIANLFGGLICYQLAEKKPSLNIKATDLKPFLTVA